MPTVTAPDGTRLAYRAAGTGDPLLCLPGGPMRDSRYLADLGGLAAHRHLQHRVRPGPDPLGARRLPGPGAAARR